MFGYHGKIAKVNLSKSEVVYETFDEAFARKYLGGNGFAAKFIYDTVKPETEPLAPENAVVFTSGPFCDTYFSGGRGHVAAISPLTGLFFDSNYGGDFALAFKRSGFDALIITGKSDKLVYIMMEDGMVSIKPAGDIRGALTSESHKWIMKEQGKGVETAVIGPAGENGIPYSSIICSGKRLSAAGRGGLATVMGAKNLKAVAARGSMRAPVFDMDAAKEYLQKLTPMVKEKAIPLTTMGTPMLVKMINDKGKLVTRNNREEYFEDAHKISGQLIEEKYKVRNITCKGCFIACGKLVSVPEGEYKGENVKMPEYETIYALGSICGNSHIVSIFNANNMCDEMGMDTISFGVTLAFLIECGDLGLVDIEGLPPFGDIPHLSDLVKRTALVEGELGRLLALGSQKLAEEIGQGSEKYLYAVKGLEIPGHSARGLRQLSIGYAVATRGGSHHDIRPQYLPTDPEVDPKLEGQAQYCFNSQNNTAIGDSLMLCRFMQERAFGFAVNDGYLPAIKAVTGWDMDVDELSRAGERIYCLERIINTERGVTKNMDNIPYRVSNEEIPAGPSKGWKLDIEDFQTVRQHYYEICGWDENGIPTPEKRKELGV